MKDLNDLSNFLGDQINQMNQVKKDLGKRIFTPDDVLEPEVDGIDTLDYPDFCDAYLESGYVKENGKVRELTDAEIDYINDTHSDWVYDLVINSF